MTSRSKPTAKRSSRFSRDGQDRHNLYVNLAFGLVIFIGLITLVGAAAATYVGSHFTEVAKVNGQSINQDTYRDQTLVDSFRLNQAEAQARYLNQLGRISDADLEARVASISQARQQLTSSSLDRLIDATLQGQLAAQQGITITDAQIDQRLTDEATQKEERRISLITVKPEVSTGATTATDAQKAAAKAIADKALADIKGGKPFADVAKAVSKDSYATAGGDAGWILADDTSLDSALVGALFALPQPGLTDVIAGSDGSYLIGQLAEIGAPIVDPIWTDKIKDAGIPMSAYRDAVRADLTREALTTKVVANATEQATVQRRVSEIFISTSTYQGPGDEVKVKHILYTPGDKPPDAQNPVASNDPGWPTAKAKAQATFDKLKALPPAELDAQFAAIAKTDSLDTGSAASGGDLQWFTQGSLDRGFGEAVFKDGLKKGDLVGPVQSQYGWHVVLFEARRGSPDTRLAGLQVQANAAGADFAKLAKENSDGSDAASGGDLGWVAHYQLEQEREAAIFAAPVGKLSDPLTTASGYYLFLVREEQTRKPDGDQLAGLKSSAFQNWFAAQKAKAQITPDLTAPSS
jgi:parvulin-like peptidyl-prolyl isomerase